jgi:ABC-type lipoprotein export system ATPase subunit
MNAAITAKDLFFLYRAPHGDIAALRGLSLEVAAGESVAVLGPSGSGKSTLLNLCAGFARPSSGTLSVLGTPFEQVSKRSRIAASRSTVGIVRQHYHRTLPPELTIEEIVSLPLRLLGRFGHDERMHVSKLLLQTGLADKADAYPRELSGGQQQRAAICAALVKRPQLLLADEPTGELDPRTSERIVALMLELASEANAASLIVTHDPAVALRTQRTIHIRDGRLAAEGTNKPVLIVDEQGWLRLPRRLREQAGVRERVNAKASWGRIELLAEGIAREQPAEPHAPIPRLAPAAKRIETEVALDRVAKRYVANVVLKDFSALFAAEQLHVIAGPSGSGKTTLLNMIAALERPDHGEVWLAGERIDGLGPNAAARLRQRVLGYVSQHSTLVEFLSARENVAIGLTLRGFGQEEADDRARDSLEWVGLAALLDRRADRLSGGEQRRVALARALASRPRVLVADEPTAHLDRISGRLVIRLLRDAAHESGTTVIAGSHDPDLIAAADTRVTLGNATSSATATGAASPTAAPQDAGSRRSPSY